MESRFDIFGRLSSLVAQVNEWWLVRIKSPCHKVVLSLIPVLICWVLWKNRNKGRYAGSSMPVEFMIRDVVDYVRYLLLNSTIIQKREVSDNKWFQDFVWHAPAEEGNFLHLSAGGNREEQGSN